jgi:hypothetical protein
MTFPARRRSLAKGTALERTRLQLEAALSAAEYEHAYAEGVRNLEQRANELESVRRMRSNTAVANKAFHFVAESYVDMVSHAGNLLGLQRLAEHYTEVTVEMNDDEVRAYRRRSL